MKYLKKINIKNIKNAITEYIKNNTFFIAFIITNLLSDILLRIITLRNLNTLLQIQPILSDLFIIYLLGSFHYLLKEKTSRRRYLNIITIIFSILCLINAIYYNFYSSFASVSLLSNLKYATQMDSEVTTSVIEIKDFIAITPLILYFIITTRFKDKIYLKNSYQKDYRWKTWKQSIYITISILLLLIINLSGVDYSRLVKQWNREYLVSRFGVYTYHANDIIKSLEPKISSVFGYDNAYKNFTTYFENKPKQQNYKNKYTNIFKDKNIILIHGESIQNFLIDLEFNGQEVTPNLNRLTKEGMYFDNFYTQVSVGTSSDSEFTLNTSLMPTYVGTAFVSYFNRSYPATPKMLRKMGYRTLAFHANDGSFWNRNAMYKSLGYDKFYSKNSFEIDEKIGLGLSDASFFRQLVPMLRKEADKHDKFMATLIML